MLIPKQLISSLYTLLLLSLSVSLVNAADLTVLANQTAELRTIAKQLPFGGQLQVTGLRLATLAKPKTVTLSRFRVFSSDAEIYVNQDKQIAPQTVYLQGSLLDQPDSIAFLRIPAQGQIRGLIQTKTGIWVLEERPSGGFSSRWIELETEFAERAAAFRCETDNLESQSNHALLDTAISAADTEWSDNYQVEVAIETDYEFFALFGHEQQALDYIGDLFAYASIVYQRELGTQFLIGWSRLWTQGANLDPWTETQSSADVLEEYRNYWNQNMGSVERTTGHMLSGKALGGGIAYIGVLCNLNYAYGLSASLAGNFDLNNPGIVWDILVATHEIGHNFDSPHTHDYCNVGGVAEPVDQCYRSACSTGGVLPCEPGSGIGDGCGTIMSYCHLLNGGYANISLTFGLNHPHGVAPERVPALMRSHVVNQAQLFPSCIVQQSAGDPILTVSKTGSGEGLVTSNPTGINCGSDCSNDYPLGTQVTLEATPLGDAVFSGWGGACSGTSTCQVNMTADREVSAIFTSENNGCAGEVALDQAPAWTQTLAVFFQYHAKILPQSSVGKRYSQWLHQHSPELIQLMLQDEQLRLVIQQFLQSMTPKLQAILDGQTVQFTQTDQDALDAMIDQLWPVASRSLRLRMQQLRQELQNSAVLDALRFTLD